MFSVTTQLISYCLVTIIKPQMLVISVIHISDSDTLIVICTIPDHLSPIIYDTSFNSLFGVVPTCSCGGERNSLVFLAVRAADMLSASITLL